MAKGSCQKKVERKKQTNKQRDGNQNSKGLPRTSQASVPDSLAPMVRTPVPCRRLLKHTQALAAAHGLQAFAAEHRFVQTLKCYWFNSCWRKLRLRWRLI
ncbi:MAG: hypothetical protein KA752_08350 [Giesbergeria sp.]|jgi:hypothetical protein|nr:hypothetical protein [Giesbergeria sp.]